MHDFLENFFDSLVNEQSRGDLIAKSRVIEAVENSTMSKQSIEQILDHMQGLPKMIDLEQ